MADVGATRAAGAATVSRTGALLLAAALLGLALNLRLSIASVPPVLDDVRATLGLSSVAAGALTMLPVLCMGAFALVAARLGRAWGEEATLLACCVLLAGGILVRLAPSVAALFAGTFLTGVAIALMNVLLPAVIRRDFERPGRMMALYTAFLGGGAAISAGVTVPLADAIGGADAWRPALALWAIPAVAAALLWAGVHGLAARASLRRGGAPAPLSASPWRSVVAWQLTAFMGLQSLLFYGTISWLPDVLHDAGLSDGQAGALLAVSVLCGLPASLVVPVQAERRANAAPLAYAAAGLWIGGLAGVLLSPASLTWAWMVLLGLAQGGSLALALTLIVMHAPDRRDAARLSGMAQSVGYLLAAFGPLLLGVLHSATGGWTAPLLALIAGSAVLIPLGRLVGRARRTWERPHPERPVRA